MKQSVQALAIVLGLTSAAFAVEPGVPITLQALHALTNAEASHGSAVAFEATVAYSRGYEKQIFLEDSDVAIYVRSSTDTQYAPGDRVLVQGTTQASFRPIVIASSVTLLHHGPAPKPVPATFSGLIRADFDARLVKVRASVRAADLVVSSTGIRSGRLQLITDGGHIEAYIDSGDAHALESLLDAEIEITGAAAGKFDDKMQQTGVVLYVSSLENIKILKGANANPWSLPITPMDRILVAYNIRDFTPRVHVQGTITYYEPGSAIVLQDGSKSLWIATHTHEPLQVGDRADATGFPDAHDRLLTLTDGEIQDSHVFQPMTPHLATWHQLGFWSSNMAVGHLYDLVSIDGQVLTEIREASQDEYVLAADGRLFTAIYRHQGASGSLPSMKQLPIGSKVRVSGICMIAESSSINPGEEVPFNILLRSLDDIAVIAKPPLLNLSNVLILLVGLLLAMLLAAGARGWALDRKFRGQTAELAYIERRRSRILEDINNACPLADIIEQITELVSFKLKGAPCWCQIVDGAQLGNCPPKLTAFRIVQQDIPAHSGPPHGGIFAALDPLTEPRPIESEALSMATALSALAIETRRLYTDLRHRSEFDLLTDTHNRFALDRTLDALIAEARRTAGIFGFIYIDLDEFKKINDRYGHHVGDMYLQEVALRMKRQLRTLDMLARQGGDEFAVLVPMVRSRAEVEEIAVRLERCLDDPFVIEGYTVYGSASVGIALYPEDGDNKDALIKTADAAMYKEKNAGR
ncbi:MAG: diguanylate cyclase domain-containing protein [Terracidiphilus sp.]